MIRVGFVEIDGLRELGAKQREIHRKWRRRHRADRVDAEIHQAPVTLKTPVPSWPCTFAQGVTLSSVLFTVWAETEPVDATRNPATQRRANGTFNFTEQNEECAVKYRSLGDDLIGVVEYSAGSERLRGSVLVGQLAKGETILGNLIYLSAPRRSRHITNLLHDGREFAVGRESRRRGNHGTR